VPPGLDEFKLADAAFVSSDARFLLASLTPPSRFTNRIPQIVNQFRELRVSLP